MDILINNVSEFVRVISEMNSRIRKEYGRSNSLLFRGQSNADNILLPSIGRHGGELIGETFLLEERNMVEMAKYKLPEVFSNSMQPVDLLALLQHHGIPTRLLDISENALVSLYFACSGENARERDGEVLLFNHRNQRIENYPMINAIADSYRFVRGERTTLESFYEQISKQSYFTEQPFLDEKGVHTAKDGAEWVRNCCSDVLIIYAKSYGLRQRIQRGRYILFPNKISVTEDGTACFEQSITPIPKDHRSIVGRIIVPAADKKQILDDLQLLGISEEMLFLDNVDITCKEIASRGRNGFSN